MTKQTNEILTNNKIQYNLENFDRLYNVEITINKDEENISIISFNAHVNYFKESTRSYFLAQVIIKDFRLNFKEPESIMEKLALRCRESLEKCVFRVTSKNELLDIKNHKEILQSWDKIKEQLQYEYEGETFDRYIYLFEKSIKDKDVLLLRLKKNLFINQYFFPIYEEYYHGFMKKNIEEFSFFNLDYKEEVLLEIENNGQFDIAHRAVISKKLVRTITNTELIPIEEYEAKYILNNDLSIGAIEGNFSNNGMYYSYVIEQDS